MILSASTLLLLGLVGVAAGWLGALVGIGGGIIIVPALVLGFGVDFQVAVATSLIAVIATSTTAGSVYVGMGLANMRLGMTLEVATTIGGVAGGLAATVLSASLLGGVFSVVMLATSLLMLRGARRPPERLVEPSEVGALGWEEPGTLAGAYFDHNRGGMVRYRVTRLPVGSMVSFLAGGLSGMLGVGGGFLKVPAMNLGMGVPIKVAAATSNFMIGVTAVASLFIYFARGFVQPLLAAPLALGVVAGSWAGTRTSDKAQPAMLKRVLAAILVLVAIQMALRTIGVGFDG
jgi:hypothetical protein